MRAPPGPTRPIAPGVNLGHVGHVGQFLCTRNGVLVLLFLNFEGYKFAGTMPPESPRRTPPELWSICA